MPLIDNILFLNEQHSTIVRGHLADMEGVINSVTFFDEDFVGFQVLIDDILRFHNGLGEYVNIGNVDAKEWYMSLPNNLYWATKGYMANLQLNEDVSLYEYNEKLLSLTVDVLRKLNESIVINPSTEEDRIINLN